MDKLDYKKAEKELYLPSQKPSFVTVPAIPFIMVDGKGDPNAADGEFQDAVGLLYALTFTIKMSKMGDSVPEGYFEYVVPPLEGLWSFDSPEAFDFTDKSKFTWTAMIRQPDFVTSGIFEWACAQLRQKKPELDSDKARFEAMEEGLCVQCMHIGSYDDEPATIKTMYAFAEANGYMVDLAAARRHHEIYISDPRKVVPDKRRTVIRLPIRER